MKKFCTTFVPDSKKHESILLTEVEGNHVKEAMDQNLSWFASYHKFTAIYNNIARTKARLFTGLDGEFITQEME